MASRILGEEQETGVPLRSVNSGLVCPYSPSPKPRAIVISVTTMTTARAHRNRLIAAVSIVRYRTINVTSLLEQPSGTYSNLAQSGSMTSIDTVDRSTAHFSPFASFPNSFGCPRLIHSSFHDFAMRGNNQPIILS